MPAKDFIPAKEENLAAMATNMSSILTTSFAAYGVLLLDATALNTLLGSFVTSLAVTKVPNTRTPTSITVKNTNKATLIADIRVLAKRIQSNPAVTAAMKVSLGITVPDHVRSPILPPMTKPVLMVDTMTSLGFTLRVADETTPTKRSRPNGTDGAEVYTFIGAAGAVPPMDVTQWTYQGRAMRSNYVLSFSGSNAGSVVHVKAAWVNPRGQSGPVSDAVVKGIAA